MPEENKIEFLPFHAINEFMRPDFRLAILKSVLMSLNELPQSLRTPIDRVTKQIVKVPGFRHSEKAPAAVKVVPMAKAFENSPELVASILAAWAEIHAPLRSQVYSLLETRGWYLFSPDLHNLASLPSLKDEKDWGILPLEADRARLPGFLIYWPKPESFEVLYDAFIKLFPDAQASIDEVSLMAVWLSMRLPYNTVDRENTPQPFSPSPETNSEPQ